MYLLANIDIAIYLVILAIFSSFIAYLNDPNKCIKGFLKRMLEGIFTAYVLFSLSYFSNSNEDASLALGGVGAWFGTEILLYLKELLDRFLGPRSRY